MKNWETRIRGAVKWMQDAEWWHFWNPGSGVVGGVIASAVCYVLAMTAWLVAVLIQYAA